VRKLLGLAIVVLIAAIAAAGMLWWSAGPKPGPHRITVEEGSTLASVARQLEAQGAIPGNATTFRGMAKIFGSADPVQAGEFEIPAGASAAEVLDILQHGRPVVRLLTIAEGMPSIIVQEKLAAVRDLTGTAPLPAEGTVLPDSYDWQKGETRAAVLKRMTDAMGKELAALWAKRTGSCVSSPQDAITGYNTYREPGLPDGPIANPGRESIAAVLDPAPTKALYFVADGTGGHVFAETLAEHNANVAKWYAIRRARGEM
jgi:UPF0755 protein